MNSATWFCNEFCRCEVAIRLYLLFRKNKSDKLWTAAVVAVAAAAAMTIEQTEKKKCRYKQMLSSNRFDIYFCIREKNLFPSHCRMRFHFFKFRMISYRSLGVSSAGRFSILFCFNHDETFRIQTNYELTAHTCENTLNTHTQRHIIDSSNKSNAAKVCSVIDELLIKHFACNNMNEKQQYSYW